MFLRVRNFEVWAVSKDALNPTPNKNVWLMNFFVFVSAKKHGPSSTGYDLANPHRHRNSSRYLSPIDFAINVASQIYIVHKDLQPSCYRWWLSPVRHSSEIMSVGDPQIMINPGRCINYPERVMTWFSCTTYTRTTTRPKKKTNTPSFSSQLIKLKKYPKEY